MRSSFKAKVSLPRQQLLHEFQQLHFGRIERLGVRNGEPVLSPMPRRVKEFKPGSDNTPRPELDADYYSKRQVVELLGYFDRMRNGTIDVIEVKHGLPFRLEHAETPA